MDVFFKDGTPYRWSLDLLWLISYHDMSVYWWYIYTLFFFFSSFADIAELDGGRVANIDFPNPNDLTVFEVTITPDSGFWKNAKYKFKFDIPDHYPHTPPKVHCDTKIYHPNINLEGKVCLNILREDWKPVLDINAVIYGLIFLFYEPNPDDPLNHEAAELFRKDTKNFERLVQRTLRGGMMDGVHFDKLIWCALPILAGSMGCFMLPNQFNNLLRFGELWQCICHVLAVNFYALPYVKVVQVGQIGT